MSLAVLLTIVASSIIHAYTPVSCHAPPSGWADTARYLTLGMTTYAPTRIWLRYCDRDVTVTLGHEILHALHPSWTEAMVRARDDGEGAVVQREFRWTLQAVL